MRVERADEGDVERDVDDRPDDHRADHGKGDVALRVARFAAELDRLLEPEVGEDDAAGGDRRKDALDAGGAKPSPAVKFETQNGVTISTMTVSTGIGLLDRRRRCCCR